MTDLPAHAAALLEAARRSHNPSPEDFERVRGALHAALNTPPATPPTDVSGITASNPPLAAPVASLTTKLKLLIAAGVIGGSASVVTWWAAQGPDAERSTRAAGTREVPAAAVAPPVEVGGAVPVAANVPAPVAATAPAAVAANVPAPEVPAVQPTLEAASSGPQREDVATSAPRAAAASAASGQAPASDRAQSARPAAKARPASRAARPSAPATEGPAPVAQPAEPEPAITPAASPQEPPAQPAPAVTPRGPGAFELALLRDALRSLNAKHPARALALLEEHAASYADSVLAQERRGLRVLALCDLGRTAEGRAEQAAFLRSSAGSPMAKRVRGACPPEGAP